MSGYVRPAAVETAVGVPGLPPGIRAYARTWVREDLRSSVVEAAILTRSTGDAERAVAELLSACGARGGRPVGIARTTGMDAGGCEVDAILPPETAPGFYAVVARRRLAVLILVSAPGEPGARALGSQLAQATAAGVAPDPGTPGEAPLPDVFVLDSGFGSPLFDQKLGGLLIAGVLLVGLRVALNRWLLGMDRGCPDSLLSPLLQFLRR